MTHPRIRITSPEGRSPGSKVELVRDNGETVDLSSCVKRVSWTLDAGPAIASVQLDVYGVDLDVIGELSGVNVEPLP